MLRCHKHAITEIFHSESAVSRSFVAALRGPAIAAFCRVGRESRSLGQFAWAVSVIRQSRLQKTAMWSTYSQTRGGTLLAKPKAKQKQSLLWCFWPEAKQSKLCFLTFFPKAKQSKAKLKSKARQSKPRWKSKAKQSKPKILEKFPSSELRIFWNLSLAEC